MATILVADNEGPIRKLLSLILRDAGHRVLAAGGGEEAVSLASRNRIDLLITDIVMPGMGGGELYAWIKTEHPEVRVLFISGYMSREPLPGGFLKKPFTPEALLAKVRELLGEAPGEARAAR